MVNISSGNGMPPVRRQAITQTDVEYLPMSSVKIPVTLETCFWPLRQDTHIVQYKGKFQKLLFLSIK